MNLHNLIPFIPILGIPLNFVFESRITMFSESKDETGVIFAVIFTIAWQILSIIYILI